MGEILVVRPAAAFKNGKLQQSVCLRDIPCPECGQKELCLVTENIDYDAIIETSIKDGGCTRQGGHLERKPHLVGAHVRCEACNEVFLDYDELIEHYNNN